MTLERVLRVFLFWGGGGGEWGGGAAERKKHVTYNMQIIEKPNRVSFVVLCHRH